MRGRTTYAIYSEDWFGLRLRATGGEAAERAGHFAIVVCLSVDDFASGLTNCLSVDEFASGLTNCLSVDDSPVGRPIVCPSTNEQQQQLTLACDGWTKKHTYISQTLTARLNCTHNTYITSL
jgi:hypothetical protein